MNLRSTLLIVIIVVLAGFNHSTSGQSGRNTQEKPKRKPTGTVRPALPPPFPKPRPAGTREPGDETIRIDTNLVTVVTSVAAATGAPLGELQRNDFEVLEDGVPQEIVNFGRDQEVPLRLVMLFDSSLSVAKRIGFQRQAAARFFGRVMRSQDQAALFAVSTDVEILQGLTGRVSLLSNATKQLQAAGATSLYDGIFLAADYLKASSGRHIIVIVSDGGDTTSKYSLQQALAKAQLANAVIFAIFSGNPYPSENLRDLAAERALATLTEETGGKVYLPYSKLSPYYEESDEQALGQLDEAFTKLANQLHTQYTLGFYSNNEKRDGRFRKLTVRIKKSGYIAHARSGYYAPKS
jgi:Ca-activated chloride channel homolog